jgi:hypothetical protein
MGRKELISLTTDTSRPSTIRHPAHIKIILQESRLLYQSKRCRAGAPDLPKVREAGWPVSDMELEHWMWILTNQFTLSLDQSLPVCPVSSSLLQLESQHLILEVSIIEASPSNASRALSKWSTKMFLLKLYGLWLWTKISGVNPLMLQGLTWSC